MRFRASMKRTVYLLLALAAVLLAVRGPRDIRQWLEQRRQIEGMERRNAQAARENELQRQRLERLRASPAEQDLEIRQRLKLVQPGERVFIVK